MIELNSDSNPSLINSSNDPTNLGLNVYIVAVTAYTSDAIKKQSLESGMKDVLGKPVNAHELELVMLKWLYGLSEQQIRKKIQEKIKL